MKLILSPEYESHDGSLSGLTFDTLYAHSGGNRLKLASSSLKLLTLAPFFASCQQSVYREV